MDLSVSSTLQIALSCVSHYPWVISGILQRSLCNFDMGLVKLERRFEGLVERNAPLPRQT